MNPFPPEYRLFVAQKEAPFCDIGPSSLRLLHAGLGISTELLEYIQADDHENQREELGDLYWYTCLLSIEVDIEVQGDSADASLPGLVNAAEELVSAIKKVVIYQNPVPLSPLATTFYWTLRAHHLNFGWEREKLLEENVAKLEKRYKKKFTTEESAERKDKQDGK